MSHLNRRSHQQHAYVKILKQLRTQQAQPSYTLEQAEENNNNSLSEQNSVTIRYWPPKVENRTVSYPQVFIEKNIYGRSTHYGHVSIAIRQGGKETYISLWPDEFHAFKSSVGTNHTLDEDIREEVNSLPVKQVVLYHLDTEKMLNYFKNSFDKVRWFLLGNLLPNSGNIYNCSSFVQNILEVGGLFENILTKNFKLSDPMTPLAVLELAELAHNLEMIKYPVIAHWHANRLTQFKNELLARSERKDNACAAINEYLLEKPDTHLEYQMKYPQEFADLLKQVYRNIQADNNQQLLTSALIGQVAKVDELLALGANLESRDKRGFNALHCMVQQNNIEGVTKLLDRFPHAVNDPIKNPLDLAMNVGDANMIQLLKARGKIEPEKENSEKVEVSRPRMQCR